VRTLLRVELAPKLLDLVAERLDLTDEEAHSLDYRLVKPLVPLGAAVVGLRELLGALKQFDRLAQWVIAAGRGTEAGEVAGCHGRTLAEATS
jgi:hypothetical protein